VDANGLVQPGKENKQVLTVSLTKEQLATLRNASRIAFTVRVEGADLNSKIQFSKSNKFDIQVGIFIKGDLNIKMGAKNQK
jgi:hypothetical protein